MRHIMVATDGSDSANRAVDVAAELTTKLGGTLSIVTVGGSLSGEETRQLVRHEGSIGDVIDSLSMQILVDARERAHRIGASDIRVVTAWGDAAEQIINAARRERSDAIVVGRRGRGQLAGLLLGSVSQKIVSLAPTVTIVVP